MTTKAIRYHDISCGHRVFGHESKCKHFHGHNYRVHFAIQTKSEKLDEIGRVLDFGVIKKVLCEWLESTWDHKMLLWEKDDEAFTMCDIDPDGVVLLPCNPTAENLAEYLVQVVGPELLAPFGCVLVSVKIEETAKCHVEVSL